MIKKIDNKTRKEMDKLIYACVSAGIRTFQSNVKCDINITLEEFLTSVLINRIGIGTGTVLNITDEIKSNKNQYKCNKKKLEDLYGQSFMDGINYNSKLSRGNYVR